MESSEPKLDKETAILIGKFLMRVDLKGAEVPAFNKVMSVIEAAAKEDDVAL